MMDFPIISQVVVDFTNEIYMTITQPYQWISSLFQNAYTTLRPTKNLSLNNRKVLPTQLLLTEEEGQLIKTLNSTVRRHSLLIAAFMECYKVLNDERIPEVLKECFSTKKDRIDAIFNMFIKGWEAKWLRQNKTHSFKNLNPYYVDEDFKSVFITEQEWINNLKSEAEALSLRNRNHESYYPLLDKASMLLNLIAKIVETEAIGSSILDCKAKSDENPDPNIVLKELNELMTFMSDIFVRTSSMFEGSCVKLSEFAALEDIRNLQSHLLKLKAGKKSFSREVDQWKHSLFIAIEKKETKRREFKENPFSKPYSSKIKELSKYTKSKSAKDRFMKELLAVNIIYRTFFKKNLFFLASEIDGCKADFEDQVSKGIEFLLHGCNCLFRNETIKQVQSEESIDSNYKDIILFVRNELTIFTEQLQKEMRPCMDIIAQLSKEDIAQLSQEDFEDADDQLVLLCQSDAMEQAIAICRGIILELVPLKAKVLKQLAVFFRSFEKEHLQQDKESWITFFKETMYKESADFIPAAMFMEQYANYFRSYKLKIPFQELDPIINSFINLEGIENVVNTILAEETKVELSTSQKSTVRSPKPKTQAVPLELLARKEDLPCSSELMIDISPVVSKPEHRRRKENAASSSNPQGVSESDDEAAEYDDVENVFARGQHIRKVVSELKSHGVDVVETGRRTGTHSRQVQAEGINPFTLSVHSGGVINSRTARDLNKIVREIGIGLKR